MFPFKKSLIFSLIGISVLMLSLKGLNKGSKPDFLSRWAYMTFAEIHTGIALVNTAVSDFVEKYLTLIHLKDENRQLKQENTLLKIQQQQIEELSLQNQRLKNMLDLSQSPELQLLASQVIGFDRLSKNQTFIINKGSRHGVKRFMGVLHPKGVVGFVFKVSPHSSQIISLGNPLSSLPAKNQRTGKKALLVGLKGQAFLSLWNQNLESKTDFQPGDVLVTVSSEQFPTGFLIGELLPFTLSKKNPSPNIPIQTAVTFDSLEELFVVLEPFKKDSWQDLINKKN